MSRRHVVTEKFREFLKEGKFLLAVSGGIDSMVLLDLFRRLPPSRRLTFGVLHYNHRLRGEESEGDVRFVEEICRRWEIPLTVGVTEPWKSKQNLQERARERRYQFFHDEAVRQGAEFILTAHQADDQAESFLIRWLQGAGLNGLAGIPTVRVDGEVTYLRPLLLVEREEIADYARRFEVPFREDSSNRDPHYLRNRVRSLVTLLKEINPHLARRTAVNSLLIRADEAYLEEELKKHPQDPKGFEVKKFRLLPAAIRYRLIQRSISALGSGKRISGEFILKLDRLILEEKGGLSYSLPGPIQFKKKGGRFGLIWQKKL